MSVFELGFPLHQTSFKRHAVLNPVSMSLALSVIERRMQDQVRRMQDQVRDDRMAAIQWHKNLETLGLYIRWNEVIKP